MKTNKTFHAPDGEQEHQYLNHIKTQFGPLSTDLSNIQQVLNETAADFRIYCPRPYEDPTDTLIEIQQSTNPVIHKYGRLIADVEGDGKHGELSIQVTKELLPKVLWLLGSVKLVQPQIERLIGKTETQDLYYKLKNALRYTYSKPNVEKTDFVSGDIAISGRKKGYTFIGDEAGESGGLYKTRIEELSNTFNLLISKNESLDLKKQQPKPPKPPSKEARQAYLLLYTPSGCKTQTEAANTMSEQLGRKVSQGEISRWINDCKTWMQATGFEIFLKQNEQIKTVDPKFFEQGGRQAGHQGLTERQRKKKNS